MTAGCQLVGSVFVDDTSPDPLYVIDLFDTSGEEDVVISDVLVKSGYFRRRDGEKNLCGDEEGRFWVSSIVRSQLDGDMKFMAQLYKIENVGDDKVLIPVNQGKNVVCCLCGLQFVTKELLIVEHTLGILQNITTTSASIRQSIVKLDGVNILLKLIKEHNKHPDCAATAVSVITNLALDISMRQKIGHHALQPLCEMLRDEHVKSCLIAKLLGCLKNLFVDCVANRMRMIDGNKWLVIVNVEEQAGAGDLKVRDEAMAALRNLWDNALDMDKKRVSCNSPDLDMELMMMQRGKRKGFGPGEWVSKPTCAVWSPKMAAEMICHDDTQQHSTTPSPTTQSPTSPGSVVEGRVYQLGEKISWCVDETHEISPSLNTEIAGGRTARIICAFLNAETGGTIYSGINRETGIVLGVRATRKKRDVIRCSIDSLLQNFKPRVPPHVPLVSFIPVRSCDNGKGYQYMSSSMEDLYVVEISIKKFAGGIIYCTPNNGCYIRQGKRNMELTAQLMRDNTLKLEEQFYTTQIRSLNEDIKKLRRLQPMT
jgi:hypothetical protein